MKIKKKCYNKRDDFTFPKGSQSHKRVETNQQVAEHN
jgi:hypothetical protein